MIYTIGYAQLTPSRLHEIVTKLDCTLYDVRAYPMRSKRGFARFELEPLLGTRYHWAGNVLGGFGKTTSAGIALLTPYYTSKTSHALLMCQEHAPAECHRHSTICKHHFPKAYHIYEDELVTEAELSRAIDEDDGYELAGELDF